MLAVRLPRPCKVFGSQMNAILLAIAANIEFNSAPVADINSLTTGREIEGNLNKAAVVFEADLAAHADSSPTSYRFANHHPIRHAAHNLVGE